MSFDPMELYFEKWLPRARRLLAPSGCLSELVLVVSKKKGVPEEQIRRRYKNVLDGKEQPDADLVFEVEQFVTKKRAKSKNEKSSDQQLSIVFS